MLSTLHPHLRPRPEETLCYQNAAGKLFYQPVGFVRLAWGNERIALADLQAYYEQTLSLLLNTGTHKILSDHGQRQPLTGLAQAWLTSNWIPRAIAQGRVRHCAIVEGADPLHRLSTQSVVSAAPAGMTFRRFAITSEAEAWLRKA